MSRILVVDDDTWSRRVTCDALAIRGHVVLQAADLAGGRALLSEDPELVLLDIHLGDGLGETLLAEIRSSARGGALPVIALTASAMNGDRERFLRVGFTGYMSKPIDVSTFARDVEAHLPARPPTPSDAVVLVVDDDAMARKVIERALRGICRVESVSGGGEALERLRAGVRYALVLCDVMMPQITGLDVADALRADAPAQLDKFVFVTGGARCQRDQQRIVETGLRVLDKPFDRAQLLAIVTPHLV